MERICFGSLRKFWSTNRLNPKLIFFHFRQSIDCRIGRSRVRRIFNQNSYEQIEIGFNEIGNAKKWLVGQETCEIILWNGNPILVDPPVNVELKIISSEPGVKGDTVSGATKPAELETGVTIQVQLFVNEGETVKVDTRD